jgi:ABC-type Fe3+-siderophore transport system permease subunit
MKTRTYMAGTLSLMINSVLFGLGAVVVLSIPALSAHATILIPAVIITSLVITPFIAWNMAPELRLRKSMRDA